MGIIVTVENDLSCEPWANVGERMLMDGPASISHPARRCTSQIPLLSHSERAGRHRGSTRVWVEVDVSQRKLSDPCRRESLAAMSALTKVSCHNAKIVNKWLAVRQSPARKSWRRALSSPQRSHPSSGRRPAPRGSGGGYRWTMHSRGGESATQGTLTTRAIARVASSDEVLVGSAPEEMLRPRVRRARRAMRCSWDVMLVAKRTWIRARS